MVLPLVAYFFVERFSRNQMLELIIRRAVLCLFFLIAILSTSIVGIISKDAGVNIEGVAFALLYVLNLALYLSFFAIFFLTIKDYLWSMKQNKQRDPDRRVAEQEAEEDEVED